MSKRLLELVRSLRGLLKSFLGYRLSVPRTTVEDGLKRLFEEVLVENAFCNSQVSFV